MWLYRALLHLYPRSFRFEYGRELAGVFAARRRRAGGVLARVALWPGAVAEVMGNAAAVHADLLRQDLRQILRGFARSRGFVLTAVLVIGLGTGASTAAFSVTEFVLFRPLPFPEPDRLVRLWEALPGYAQMELSPPNARDWRARQRSFDGFGLFASYAANLTDAGDPVRVDGAMVDAELLQVLGVPPAIGRPFAELDEVPNGPATVLISHALWQSRFGGAPGILGRRIGLDGVPHEIVGVMPAAFAFPEPSTEYWIPLRPNDSFEDRNNNFLDGVARLRPGVDVDAAQRELRGIAAQLEEEHPVTNRRASANVVPLREGYASRSRTLVLALAAAAACLLVITCVNLVNLMLARLLARRRELVVRTVLGAGRERLARQQVTETLLLAAAGGLLGVALATLIVPLFVRLVPTSLPLAGQPDIDWRVWMYAAAVTAGTGLLTGLLPVMASRRADFSALRDGERAGGGARERMRASLVATSIVASVVLLVGAGLLLRAMWTLQAVDPGFVAHDVLTVRTALPDSTYASTALRTRWYRQVLDDVRALPGVSQAAYISFLPMEMGGGIWPVALEGVAVRRDEGHVASLRFVTPGFFDTMQIPLLHGRDVSDADTVAQPIVAVVSQSFVERYWPGQPPIGRRFTFAFAEREVIGVVGDIRVRGLERDSEPQVYLPAGQVLDGGLWGYTPKELVIRVDGHAAGLTTAVREIIRRADPNLPIANVRWLDGVVAEQTAPRAVQLQVLSAFAAAALLLAGVGLHGLLSFVVSQRRQEIGVRMALGALRGQVLVMVLRRAAKVAGGGLIAGLVVAYWAGRGLEAVLAGVPRTDPLTLGSVCLLVGLVTVAGSLTPAVRAMRVDPVQAIRSE